MGPMRYCTSCTRFVHVDTPDLNLVCCTYCGKVLEEHIYSNEATFTKDASGQSRFAGNLERSRKRKADVKDAHSASEAAYQMLNKKIVSARINFEVLEELLGGPVDSDDPKKSKTETPTKNNETENENNEYEEDANDELEYGNIYEEYQDHHYLEGDYYEEDEPD